MHPVDLLPVALLLLLRVLQILRARHPLGQRARQRCVVLRGLIHHLESLRTQDVQPHALIRRHRLQEAQNLPAGVGHICERHVRGIDQQHRRVSRVLPRRRRRSRRGPVGRHLFRCSRLLRRRRAGEALSTSIPACAKSFTACERPLS